jgi:hypothetical protein
MAVNNLNTPGVGIQPSLIDAKGDLLVGTANDAIDRLGVTGTTGAVLTADAGETTGLKWAAAGSVGGLVHINTTTFSAVTSVSLANNTFTSTFDSYLLILNYAVSQLSVTNFRTRLSGTDATGANYNYFANSFQATYINQANATSQTSAYLGELENNHNAMMQIDNISLAQNTRYAVMGNAGGGRNGGFGTGSHIVATAYDSCTFFRSAGTMTGTITAFGVKK